MDQFVAAVSRVRDLKAAVNNANVDEAALAYIDQEARLSEAEIVAPCVSRFVSAEVGPATAGKAVGRSAGGGKTSWAPPIGTYVPRSRKSDTILPSLLRGLAVDTLAQGYFAWVEGEADFAAGDGPEVRVFRDRTAEYVWRFWVANMSNGKLLRSRTDPDALRRIANECGESFFNGLQELGLGGGPLRRPWKRSTGSFYGEAGMLLRKLQTDSFQPEAGFPPVLAGPWPFDQMPSE